MEIGGTILTTSIDKSLKQELIVDLYNSGAIKFGSFTLKSGKQSPYYIQLRELSSYDNDVGRKILKKIGSVMGQLIFKTVPDVDRIVGIAYAGIPLAIAITMETGISSCYTRKEVKSHGISRLIEGQMKQDDMIVLIDDLITTGESKLEAKAAILAECEARGITVHLKGIFCLVDREEGGIEFLTKEGLNTRTVFTISEAVHILREQNLLPEAKYQAVLDYVNSKNCSS